MLTLDSQVHAYERNHPDRPWVGSLYGPAEVTGDQMVAAMDTVGVDGVVLVSPFSMYRYDASYALEVYRAHPSRFRLVKPVDPADPAVAKTIADWASTRGHGRHSGLHRGGGSGRCVRSKQSDIAFELPSRSFKAGKLKIFWQKRTRLTCEFSSCEMWPAFA